eukprot:3704040-Amphidinium_carterae.1
MLRYVAWCKTPALCVLHRRGTPGSDGIVRLSTTKTYRSRGPAAYFAKKDIGWSRHSCPAQTLGERFWNFKVSEKVLSQKVRNKQTQKSGKRKHWNR